jgi:hypothetical protein
MSRSSALPALGLAATALVIAALVAWRVVDDQSAGPERGASIDEIAGAPADWVGKRVEVSGRVTSVYPEAFTIGSADDAELLVIPGERSVGPGEIGVRMRVAGTVEVFDEQTELVPGEENEPREGDALLRASRIERRSEGS